MHRQVKRAIHQVRIGMSHQLPHFDHLAQEGICSQGLEVLLHSKDHQLKKFMQLNCSRLAVN
jgi:hypothetical protein